MYKAFIGFLLLFACLSFTAYTLTQCQPLRLSETLSKASRSFNSRATYFEVYDITAGIGNADRLIIIQPYGWIVLANAGSVYIVEPDDHLYTLRCSSNHTLAIRFEENATGQIEQKAVCLEQSFAQLLQRYTRATPSVTSFETELSFTVFNALQILAAKGLVGLSREPSAR